MRDSQFARAERLARRLGGLCFVVAFLWCMPAFGQPTRDELARKHFESGAAYLQQSDYESALREFESAYELSPRPELLLNIATVYERMGKLDEAVQALGRYLAAAPDGEHAETVQLRIDNLNKRRQERDQEAEPTQPPAPPALADANPPAPSTPLETTHSEPPPAPAPTLPGPPPPSESRSSTGFTVALVLGGAGLAAIGATVTGLMANAEYGDLEGSCKPNCTDDQVSRGKNLALASTLLTGVAVVGAAAGVTLWLWSPADEVPVASATPELSVVAGVGGARADARWRF